MKKLSLFATYTKTSLFTAGLLLSGNALATHFNGTLNIVNKTSCQLQINQTNDSNKAIIELTEQKLAKRKTSADIIFQIDSGAYASGNAFLNATCKAEGNASGKYFTLLIAGAAGGSFHTEADCKAAISATVEGGQGVLPGAFANLRVQALDKKTGEISGELSTFITRKSASGVIVSSRLSTLELCGPGNGFFRVRSPTVKPLAAHGLIGNFKQHNIVVEDASSDRAFIEAKAEQAIKLHAARHVIGPQNMFSQYVNVRDIKTSNIALNKDKSFALTVKALGVRPDRTKHLTTNVTIERYADLNNLFVCASLGLERLIVMPSREFPLEGTFMYQAESECRRFSN